MKTIIPASVYFVYVSFNGISACQMSHSLLFEITNVLDLEHTTGVVPYQDIAVNAPGFLDLAILIGLATLVEEVRTCLCQVVIDKDWVRRRCC